MSGVLFRIFIGVIFGLIGAGLGLAIGATEEKVDEGVWAAALGIGFFSFGYLIAPYAVKPPLSFFRKYAWLITRYAPMDRVVAAAIGLALALVIAALITLPLSHLPEPWDEYSPIVSAILLCIFFVPVMLIHGRGVTRFFFSTYPKPAHNKGRNNGQLILDTNAIIDGRIADVVQTGFIEGTLLIPRFVLDELRHIADSQDPTRRVRGRRGLDMLNQLQRGSDIPVHISNIDFSDTREVDAKLIRLAKTIHCPIVSNDMNLNRAASLEGVKVLNINELANAVKSVVLQGESIAIVIVQEGKEPGQGIGFLDDGTMIVVEGGRRHINQEIEVSVTRVLQTAAGKMIFAQLKGQNNDET